MESACMLSGKPVLRTIAGLLRRALCNKTPHRKCNYLVLFRLGFTDEH